MKNKYLSTIGGATIFLAFIGIVSRGLGFFREVTFAGYYGLSSEFDLYLVGNVIPVTINTIILFVAQNIFVPLYHKYSDESMIKLLLYRQLRNFLYIGLTITVVLFLFTDVIINFYQPNVNTSSFILVKNIFIISILSIPFSSLNSILIVYLQAKYEFKNAATSQLFVNIFIIILVVLFSSSLNIYAIPFGYIIGTLIQTVYLVLKTRINLISIFTGSKNFNDYYKLSINSIIIIAAIESLGQLYMFIDRLFLERVDTGGIASINYAQNIFFLPMQIFSIALTTAIFPKLSQYYSNKNFKDFRLTLDKSINIIIIIFIPITLILIFWGDQIIILFYERGKFLSNDSLTTYHVLQMLTISLFFYSIYAILNKIFFTANLTFTLLIITLVGILIKFSFNFILVTPLSQKGLALSTTITYIFFFTASLITFKLNGIYTFNSRIFYSIIASFGNSMISLFLVITIFSFFSDMSIYSTLLMLISFFLLYSLNLYFYDNDSFKKINFLTSRIK